MKIVILALLLVLSACADEQIKKEAKQDGYDYCYSHYDCYSLCCLYSYCRDPRLCYGGLGGNSSSIDPSKVPLRALDSNSSPGFIYWGLLGLASFVLVVALAMLWHYRRKALNQQSDSTAPLATLRDQSA